VRLAAALAAAALSSTAAAGVPFSFGVIGDTPYWELEVPGVRRMLDDMAAEGVAFVVHVGDVKSGTSRCSDELLQDRRVLLDASLVPLVFVPGDNDWTDCHRESAGAYPPRERLERLRVLFFDSDESLGRRRLRVMRQSADPRFRVYRENVRWTMENVVFVTLNVPGSNNNLGRNAAMDAEHVERMAANFAWLDDTFKLVREPTALALVIFAHGDPHFGTSSRRTDGYIGYRNALREHAAALSKPVLLVHGDGHRYWVDQPLRDPHTGKRLTNFTRVQVFGSPTVNWVRIDVASEGERVFSISPGASVPPP